MDEAAAASSKPLFHASYATPRGVFSNRSPPDDGRPSVCVWAIYGHGEMVWPDSVMTREKYDDINKGWEKDMPLLGPFSRINCTVSKVVGPKSHAPGLSTYRADTPTTTNFALHIPMMTKVVTDRQATLSQDTLDVLGQAVMRSIRQVDTTFGIDYPKEETSTPALVLPNSFYVTSKINEQNFWESDIRKIYMKPNFGELLRPSGQLRRTVVDGPNPFPIYGFYVIYAEGGSLPQECTLFGAQRSLSTTPVSVEGNVFPTFDTEKVKKYNLISVENRAAVEQKMGHVLRFLDENDLVIPGKKDEWDRYRHDTGGVIQLLRRVVRSQEITQVEGARIIQALRYHHMLGMDSACNCPGDKVFTQDVVFDSQDESLFGPISHKVLAKLNDGDFVALEELRALQEVVLKLARTALDAAERATAAAAQAARAAAAEAEAAARAAAAEAAAAARANVIQACKVADESVIKAQDVLLEAERQIGLTPFGNNPLLVRTLGEIKKAVAQAKAAAAAAVRVQLGADLLENLGDGDRPPFRDSTPSQGASGGVARPPSGRGGGGGSAKKYSRKRARSRTQKQKRYISRNTKQIKKYAKRHTMRNRRRKMECPMEEGGPAKKTKTLS